MPLFLKNVVHFGCLTNEMECERGNQDFSNKVIVLMQQVSLYFKTKKPGKRISRNVIQFGQFQLLQRQISEGNR